MSKKPNLEDQYCQKQIEGIYIDPVMRDGFEDTPHKERDPKELEDWSMKPYIVTMETPDGVRYEVRCLDGAELNGSSALTDFDNLEKAVALAKIEPTNYFELTNYFEAVNQKTSKVKP